MSPLPNRSLERQVRESAPEPPPGLLETLLSDAADVPPLRLVSPAKPSRSEPPATAGPARLPVRSSRPYWALAASLVTVIGGGMLAWRVVHQAPPLSTAIEQALPAPSPVAPPSPAATATAATAKSETTVDPRRAEAATSGSAQGPDDTVPTVGRATSDTARSNRTPVTSGVSAGQPAPAATVAFEPLPSTPTTAVSSSGAMFVTATDEQGAPLPGVTVTIAGAGAPLYQVSNHFGHVRFLALPVGNYRLEAALEGFSTLVFETVNVRTNQNTQLELRLSPAVEDVVTVTAESPLLDERKIATGSSVNATELEKVPTSRDPWAVLGKVPGVQTDRINVGGNESGQQSQYVGPGSSRDQVVWAVDGTVITDMRAVGAPPVYYNFDTFEEMGVKGEGQAATPSTGGTAEPNDAPYGDVFFRGYGVNPFVDTEDDALSTFGLDVDTASYNVVRRYLTDGHLPPADAVRVEEMVNAFDYADPAAKHWNGKGGDFALRADGAPSPWAPRPPVGAQTGRYYLLRLAVDARQVAATDRRPADLVFVVDISGSMATENRLGLVKRSLHLLLGELRTSDRVALVVYGSRGEVRLPFTADHQAIAAAIDRLQPEGSTNAEEGINLGYDLALREGRRDAMRRIVLCSDGVANVGRTGPDSLLANISAATRDGVELTTVGFGMGNYNDVLMEQLADRGNGRYAYVDTLDEARRIFVENLTGTLETVAAEARAQVEFDPATVSRWRLLGYENRDIADERFRDDTVDAGEIGAGHAVTALYEVKLQPKVERDRNARIATLHLRWRPAQGKAFVESELQVRRRDLAASWEAGSTDFRLASVVARFAEVLRGSYWARGADLETLAQNARRLVGERPADERVAELAQLIATAAKLQPARTP